MDNDNFNTVISCVVAIATLISAVYGVISFKKQKEYEKYEIAFKEFYIPLLQLIEKHLYVTNYNTPSFMTAKTSIHQLIEDKYIYVPFDIQNTFSAFEATPNEINYKMFCDHFLYKYCEVSKACGMKRITVRQRNKNKWYSSVRKRIFVNLKYGLDCLYIIFVGLEIWLILLLIFLKSLIWIGII